MMATKIEREKQLNDTLNEMVRVAVEDNRRWEPVMRDGVDYMFNNQLSHQAVRPEWERIQANYIFSQLMQEIAILAQRRPKPIAQPEEDTDQEGAQLWEQRLQWQFKKNLRFEEALESLLMDAKTHGNMMVKLFWEPQPRGGWDEETGRWVGRVEMRQIDPMCYLRDPECDGYADPEFEGTLRMLRVDAAKKRWSKFADEIEAEANNTVAGRMQAPGGLQLPTRVRDLVSKDQPARAGEEGKAPMPPDYEGRIARLLYREGGQRQESRDGQMKPTHVQVLDIVFLDPEEETVDIETPIPVEELIADGRVVQESDNFGAKRNILAATGEELTNENRPKRELKAVKRPKYPNGRHIIRIGEATVLLDEPYPYRHWPYAVGTNIKLPRIWRGMNGVELARGLQDWINICLQHMAEYVKEHADPVTKIEQGALQNDPDTRRPEKLKRHAGAVWKLAQGALNRVGTEQPAAMAQGMVQLFGIVIQEIRNIIGMQDPAVGRGEAGVTATATLSMQQNTRLRVALQALALNRFIIEILNRVVEIDKAESNAGDLIRVLGPKHDVQRVEATKQFLDAHFDLQLDVTVGLPFDEEKQRIDAQQIFGFIGLPYLDRLLEAYDVKNKDELLEKVDVWQLIQDIMALDGGLEGLQQLIQQLEAQQAAQEEQAQGGQGAPAPQGGGGMPMPEAAAGHPQQLGARGGHLARQAGAAAGVAAGISEPIL